MGRVMDSKEDDAGTSEFVISKPELQAGLAQEILEGEVPVRYVNRYHAEEKVRCAFCAQHQAHNRGFTALMEDGRIALCGRDCGIKYFGLEAAAKFEEELDQQIRRETKRRIILRTLAGVPAILALLSDDLLKMEAMAFDACQRLLEEFQQTGIFNKTDENGNFVLTETRRRWVDQVDKDGRSTSVPIDESYNLLTVKKAVVLQDGVRPQRHFEKAKKLLTQLASKDIKEELSDTVVDRMTQHRTEAISALRNGVRFLENCSLFFTKDNAKALTQLCHRANSTVERISLHKRPTGFDLTISEASYRENEVYPVPDFNERPKVDDFLSLLRDTA